MTSNSFLTSSFEAASGAIETVGCALAQMDKTRELANSSDFNFMNTSRVKYRSRLTLVVQRVQAQEPRRPAQFFLNPQQLVVLGDAVGTRGGAGFDLAGAGRDRQIGDKGVFSFAGTVGDHRRVPVAPRQIDGLQSLADCPDLVNLDQNRVGHAFVDALLQELNIGHEDVVTDQLNLPAEFF